MMFSRTRCPVFDAARRKDRLRFLIAVRLGRPAPAVIAPGFGRGVSVPLRRPVRQRHDTMDGGARPHRRSGPSGAIDCARPTHRMDLTAMR
jgi:hypothetical protein